MMPETRVCLLTALGTLTLVSCSSAIPLPRPRELAVKQTGFGPQATVDLSWRLVLRVSGYRLHFDDDGPGAPYLGRGLGLVRWPERCGDLDAGTRISSSNGADSGAHEAGADEGGTADASPGTGDADVPDGAMGTGDAALADAASESRDARPRDGQPGELGASDAHRGDRTILTDVTGPGVAVDSPIFIPEPWCQELVNTYADAGIQPSPTPGARPRVRLQGLLPGRTYFFAVQTVKDGRESELSEEAALQVLAERPQP